MREHYQSKYIAYVKCPMVKFIDSFTDYSFPKLLTIISPLIISFSEFALNFPTVYILSQRLSIKLHLMNCKLLLLFFTLFKSALKFGGS